MIKDRDLMKEMYKLWKQQFKYFRDKNIEPKELKKCQKQNQ